MILHVSTRTKPGAQKLPILFLHAFPLNSSMWYSLGESFSEERNCVAVDFRGFGRTAATGPITVGDFAEDVCDTMDSLGLKQAILCGCSMGGYVAFEMWRRSPERIAAMVLMDTRADTDTDAARTKRTQMVERLQKEGAGFLPDFVADNMLSPDTRAKDPGYVSWIKGLVNHSAAENIVEAVKLLAKRPDSRPTLKTITVPTLVLVGEHDAITPFEAAQVIKEGIPNAELAIIPSAGHLSPLEQPHQVHTMGREFLQRHQL
jgi:3-oxoadipate enol-lactonase